MIGPAPYQLHIMTKTRPSLANDSRSVHSLAVRILKGLLGWCLALVILFEEWGWEPLQRVMAWVGSWPGFRWVEARIRRLPSYAALALFLLPALALIPIKLLALWLITSGKVALGTIVIVIAKLVGTATVSRLFALTNPALMELAWFARQYQRWVGWKEALLTQVRASRAWRLGMVLKHRVRNRVKSWMKA